MIRAQVWSLFDRSGIAVKPWHDAGFSVCTVDEWPASHDMPSIRCDILSMESLPGARFVLAFPPCTHLAASGARWWQSKGDVAVKESMALVNKAISLAADTPLVLENPVGRLSTLWCQPSIIVHPWEFAGYEGASSEAYSKKTCLWLRNGAMAPARNPPTIQFDIDDKRIHHMNSWERKHFGILTPVGLAQGIFLANKHLV